MKVRVLASAVLALGLAAGLTACGDDDGGKKAASGPMSDHPMSGEPMKDGGMTHPFGPACAAVPASGMGSFDGMAADPVATAASHNPALSTLVSAVKKAGLVDTLNSADGITVFAPTNDAFAKIPKMKLEETLADKKKLTALLTYHVVKGRQDPKALEHGTLTSLQGGTVTTTGMGTSYKVDGAANVVCGNVATKNATVYIIDSVLMPK
ncbi:fasciclin domain-containing protein [Actinomadura atramentaria]|uniref:fasciclin domain-containing protein n=1 Tax=Actinomadura atramentaria TaxID=1990 RepID=UPI000362FBD9|nr:fasciclin domain-containing protein [Actinomadura atramentaria]